MLSDRCCCYALCVFLVLSGGCSSERQVSATRPIINNAAVGGESDAAQVRAADMSILFVGNSHTSMHDLPGLISAMIRFRHPGKKVYTHVIGVGFLEDIGRDTKCKEELESRPWKYVVLQAQKESKSGNYKYSQKEGIEIAKLAKAKGAKVIFYSEWGLREVPGHGPRIEAVYNEMATASEARVAPVGRAWDLALAAQPGLALFADDGNHQSALGAFLTASVLFGRLTDENPATLAAFRREGVSVADRKVLLDAAVKALVPVR